MANDNEQQEPVEEGAEAPGRGFRKKEESGFDAKAFYTLSLAGITCGVCMWLAFSWVGGTVDLKSLVGAVFGGWLSGLAIFVLS